MPLIDLGKRGWVTRDCPNVLLPTLVQPISVPVTNSWAWPASYTQLIAAGVTTYPLLLTQLHLQFNLYKVYTADVNTSIEELLQVDIGTGAAAAETSIGVVISATSGIVQIIGVLGDVTILLAVTPARHISLGPVPILAGTRIAARASKSGTATGNLQVYISGYDLTALDFAPVSFLDDLYVRGMRPDYPKPLVSLGSTAATSGAAWVMGNYAVVSAALDEDYLIRSAAIQGTQVGLVKSAQFDIALGAAGLEVIQTRVSRMGAPGLSYRGTSHIEFQYPFIAYKGERLAVRVASAQATSISNVMIFGERLT